MQDCDGGVVRRKDLTPLQKADLALDELTATGGRLNDAQATKFMRYHQDACDQWGPFVLWFWKWPAHLARVRAYDPSRRVPKWWQPWLWAGWQRSRRPRLVPFKKDPADINKINFIKP